MSKTVAGRKPISSKSKPVITQAPDFFQDKFTLPAALREELKAKNLDYRFIDYKKYVESGGAHERGWSVYRPDNKAGLDPLTMGMNPDGIVRRGSAVLATRPMNHSEQHRDWLASKANVYKRFKQTKAEEMRQRAREASADSIIDDEFDDEEND